MSRATEKKRLIGLAVASGGYVVSLCPKCGWWQLQVGDRVAFERDYNKKIRCNC